MRKIKQIVATVGAGAALVISLAGCSALEGITGNSADSGQRDESSGEITEASDMDAFAMKVGDCINDQDGTEVSSVPVVPCSEPHDNEVYFTVDSTATEFPGNDAIMTEADEVCQAPFESYVGLDYESSTLDYASYFPTSGSWSQGDREIVCIAYDPAGPITGTLSGAQR